MSKIIRSAVAATGATRSRLILLTLLLGLGLGLGVRTNATVTTITTLADQPVFATNTVPGNMAFTLSVEFPTAISVANLGDYSDSTTYLGYFDPAKCYSYQYNSTIPASSYFAPAAFATGGNGHSCSAQWSGNFMNWATMQTIDPFRWVLTGGYRSLDGAAANQTILEKAWGASQGGTNNFPYRGTTQPTGNKIAQSLVATVTPFTNWPQMNTGIWGNGNTMLIAAGTGYTASTFQTNVYDLPSNVNAAAPTPGQPYTSAVPNTSTNVVTYRAYIRVSVCDTSVLGVLGLESNCTGYGTPSGSGTSAVYPIYKPTGLMQQYANQIKYGVLGYLNNANQAKQGGVLREPMEYIGPTYPTPLSTTVTTNPTAEWNATTGVMGINPDTATAAATTVALGSTVSQSGVMNYINQFGEYGAKQYLAGSSNYPNNTNIYMTYDNVSELYYAAIRYFENLGNVPQWLPQAAYGATSVQLDGFPAVTTWTDPIAYRCQKNFILGIGDDHTWQDYDVGGSTQTGLTSGGHSPVPPLVSGDTFNKANTWLNELQVLEGLPQQPFWGAGASSAATQYIAGLAYGAHVLDIRPDLTDTQTIATYWMDVAEDQEVENENPYYLATKYGGFTVPSGYSITNTTPLTLSEYDTSGNSVIMNGGTSLPLPDNYFQAGTAAQMVKSLTTAFTNIALAAKLNTTAFSLANNNSAATGTYSFGSSYNSTGWTSTIIGSTISYPGGVPTLTQAWSSDVVLQSQFAGTGWQTNRKIVTWSNGSGCGSSYAGVPFEAASLCSSTQLSALANPTYSTSTTGAQYLNYLRGDVSNQVGCTTSCGSKSLRARSLFLGDIVDAALTPIGAPALSYSDGNDPGYSSFKSTWAARPTMLYAGANDGMLHGFLGSSGTEVFAYVPSPLFQGPTGTPQVNGLAQLGNPNYNHHFYVDATPATLDVDLYNTWQSAKSAPCPENTTATCWSTLLVGGLGKGGTSFYALNVTDPTSMQSANETQIAQKNVMWEYTDSATMGYSFGVPVMVKTAQYGWVVLLTSGYDNPDGYGYLYVVNPANGALLQKIKTPLPSVGLTQVSAYVQDYTDYTADSAYVGDLNGQLWRFDLTAQAVGGVATAYPAPTLLAQLTDAYGVAQPVTSAPLIQIHPNTRLRYVLLGTGKLLTATDVGSTQSQSFYAIIDGTAGTFNKTVTTPITRATMTQVADVTAGVTLSTTSKGLYVDLGNGYRVLNAGTETDGVVAFSALLPSVSDPCNPQGSSHNYALNYSTGQSVINSTTAGVTTPQPYIALPNAVSSLAFINNGTSTQLIAGGTDGSLTPIPITPPTLATRVLNWREIPTPD